MAPIYKALLYESFYEQYLPKNPKEPEDLNQLNDGKVNPSKRPKNLGKGALGSLQANVVKNRPCFSSPYWT